MSILVLRSVRTTGMQPIILDILKNSIQDQQLKCPVFGFFLCIFTQRLKICFGGFHNVIHGISLQAIFKVKNSCFFNDPSQHSKIRRPLYYLNYIGIFVNISFQFNQVLPETVSLINCTPTMIIGISVKCSIRVKRLQNVKIKSIFNCADTEKWDINK